jgi:hypothetical protein
MRMLARHLFSAEGRTAGKFWSSTCHSERRKRGGR